MNEFVCPNGRMSVNGVCPIFEGDDGQIKDIKKTSTYDALKEDEITEKDKGIFEFDFEKPTESTFQSAGNIISNNLNAYNNFVENKLGIPSNVQNVFRVGSALATSSIVPFVIPFIAGGALKSKATNQQQSAINRESTRDLQNRINKGEFGSVTPSAQDDRRTSQYNQPSAPTKSFSAPQQTSGFGGLHNYG